MTAQLKAQLNETSRFSDGPQVPTEPPKREIMFVQDVIRESGYSRSSVWGWVYSGRLPTVVVGGRRHCLRSDFEKLLGLRSV